MNLRYEFWHEDINYDWEYEVSYEECYLYIAELYVPKELPSEHKELFIKTVADILSDFDIDVYQFYDELKYYYEDEAYDEFKDALEW